MRSSHFSLNFSMNGPSNSGETKGKVDPHCKSYAWVPEVWSFDKLREVGFSPTWLSPCLRTLLMVRDVLGPTWSFIQFQKLGLSGENS